MNSVIKSCACDNDDNHNRVKQRKQIENLLLAGADNIIPMVTEILQNDINAKDPALPITIHCIFSVEITLYFQYFM